MLSSYRLDLGFAKRSQIFMKRLCLITLGLQLHPKLVYEAVLVLAGARRAIHGGGPSEEQKKNERARDFGQSIVKHCKHASYYGKLRK